MHSATQRWWLGVIVAGVAIAVLAEPRAQPAPSEETAVLDADQALSFAMRGGDKSVARRLLSLQFTFVDAQGKIHERKEFLADLKAVAAVSAGDPTVKIYGRIGTVTGHRKAADGRDVFFLDIWAKQKRAWRVLVSQDVMLAAADVPSAGGTGDAPGAGEADKVRGLAKQLAKILDCKNPCETIPYRVRSPVEQDIVNTFQATERATVARNGDEYGKHLAAEFVHYESDYPPVSRSERIERLEDRKQQDIPAVMTAIQSMRLWVYGDGAAMTSASGMPDDAEPLLRIARVWVKRNGQWQLAISVITDVK
jgi:Domain of unknown function (DUF4440)